MKKTVVATPIIARAAAAVLLGSCSSSCCGGHEGRPSSSNAAFFFFTDAAFAGTTGTMALHRASRELEHTRESLCFPWTRDGRRMRQWGDFGRRGSGWSSPLSWWPPSGDTTSYMRLHAKRKPRTTRAEIEVELAGDMDDSTFESDPVSREGVVVPNAGVRLVDDESIVSNADDVDQEPKKAPRKRKAKKSRKKSDDDDGADDAEDLLHWILDTDRAVIQYRPIDALEDTAIAVNGMSVEEWTRKASRRIRTPKRNATGVMIGSADPLAPSTSAAPTTTTTGAGAAAAHSVRFVVRGPPRPLVRHRVSTFRMYNPSAKAQKSFQGAIRTLLSNARVEHMTAVNGNVDGVTAPSPPTQPDGSDGEATPPVLFPTQSLAISIVFRMKRPLHHFMAARRQEGRLKKSAPPQTFVTRTDVDNLAKFVLDSLNGLLYDDDRQVCSLHATKILDNDGLCLGSTEVGIRVLDDNDLPQLLDASFRAFDGVADDVGELDK